MQLLMAVRATSEWDDVRLWLVASTAEYEQVSGVVLQTLQDLLEEWRLWVGLQDGFSSSLTAEG